MEKWDEPIKVVAFDADDTLWDCQSHFEQVERDYCDLLSVYDSPRNISASLFEVESANMDDLGYGCKAFTLSLVENAVRVSHGKVTGGEVMSIINLGRSLLRLPATPLDGVAETLDTLRRRGYRLAVLTKGELQDQENKLQRSGLNRYFDHVSIVSNKTEQSYKQLCADMHTSPSQMCMVGNSFKSDIAPALRVGYWAVHIPFSVTWKHEEAQPFEHPRLQTIDRFARLLNIL